MTSNLIQNQQIFRIASDMSEGDMFSVGEIQVAVEEQEPYKRGWETNLSEEIPGLKYQYGEIAPVINGPTTIAHSKMNGPSAHSKINGNIDKDNFESEIQNDTEDEEGHVVENGNQIEQKEEKKEEDHDFVIHKVGKMDTLISLAVKYNVSVQDLKRANNIISELELYTKDNLLIPTKSMPIDKEMMIRAAQIMSGYDRTVHVGQAVKKLPGTSALMKQAGADAVRQDWEAMKPYYSSFDFPGDYMLDDSIIPISSDRHKQAGDVELSTLSSVASQVKRISWEAGRATKQYFNEHVRHRFDYQEYKQDAAPLKRSVSTPQSRVRERLSHARHDIFFHTKQFGQTIGRGVRSLSRRIRDALHSSGSRPNRFADISDDILAGGQSTMEKSPSHQELVSMPEATSSNQATFLSQQSWSSYKQGKDE